MNYNEQLKETIEVLNKLKLGIDPITENKVDDNSIINNIKVSRALCFAYDVLNQNIKFQKNQQGSFYLKKEELELITLDDKIRTISEIASLINDKVIKEDDTRKKLNQATIGKWLIQENFLVEVKEKEKNQKRPTEEGEMLGINVEVRSGMYGFYKVNIYTVEAQQFIIDHIDCFVEIK